MRQPPSARILVVDDEVAHMTALCDTLRDRGFDVTGFSSPDSALNAAREEAFDLLLTDLMMPGMGGIDLLRSAQEIQPQLVGVLMTGHGTIDTAVEAMKVGALDYILKPFKLSTLLPVLSRALAVRQLRLENAALQKKVLERTQELEASNRDLEAFSYSVSHDLMAPLRAVHGFAEILSRDYAGELPAGAEAHLAKVVAGAERMQRLIRDLLRFSRLGLRPVDKRALDVATMVKEAVDEVRQQEGEREVEVIIGELPDAFADPSLIRQVFVNLLTNAFKFTRRTDHARIEVGSEARPHETVYFVKDNGAGFEMEYAQQVFGVFERLHDESQFEGTGIGLSVARRIVERHGGMIWAEAQVDKGAVFSFSLPHDGRIQTEA